VKRKSLSRSRVYGIQIGVLATGTHLKLQRPAHSIRVQNKKGKLMKMIKTLTPKQQLFIIEYLKDFNATQAAVRAGYSKKTAYSIGEENLKKPEIRKAITEKMEKRAQRLNVDADDVLRRLVEIDQMDLLDILNDDLSIKPLGEWSEVWRKTVRSIDLVEQFAVIDGSREQIGFIKKLKLPDKIKNLELIGRHVDVQAWKDKAEVDVKQHVTIAALADEIRKERLINS
jgi:phage terminase small subunit